MILLLPRWDESNWIVDGSCIQCCDNCKASKSNQECIQHYANMQKRDVGFYSCPHGFSTLVWKFDGQKIIFTGFRERSTYLKKLNKTFLSNNPLPFYNPILSEAQLLDFAKHSTTYIIESEKLKETENLLAFSEDTLHEIRALTTTIKSKCDIIENTYSRDAEGVSQENAQIIDNVKGIHVSSFILQARFMLYDYLRNPDGQFLGEPASVGVHKKFHKITKLLNNAEKSNVHFDLNGKSILHYNIYPTFEILIFLILENAVKYSPPGKSIDIIFTETTNAHCSKLSVEVRSLGPYCSSDELTALFKRGVRGKNAIKSRKGGSGVGLHLAKILATHHDIVLTLNSEKTQFVNKVQYGTFCVRFDFNEENLIDPNF